ncbi:MAG TPA: hypothetical protein VH000_06305 [Rhizomicrobium sp.]|jgi:ornithine decarboxylase|nr:hypothetical protein [Rhizomicrobium sp.]
MNAPAIVADSIPRFASAEDVIAREQPGEPTYVLWPEKFNIAAKRFLDGFPGDALYAVKSNPHPYVLDLVYAAGIRHFDTASLHEIELIRGRFPDADCHFMAPVRAVGAAKAAFHKHGIINYSVDCEFELEKLLAETSGGPGLCIFVRIATPLGGALLELSSKFGATQDEAAKLLKRVKQAGAQCAITFHVGSQCLSPFSYAQAIDMAHRTAQAAGVELAAMDIGGGFPAPYNNNDVPPYPWYFDTIREAVELLPGGKTMKLMCEPGRALIAEGVSLITQIILRKGSDLYMNDGVYGSFDELTLPGWTGAYPMTAYRAEGGGVTPLEGPPRPFRVYGPTCDSLDMLPKPLLLPDSIGAGDFLLFDAVGAYSIALRTNFNGFLPDRWAIAGN